MRTTKVVHLSCFTIETNEISFDKCLRRCFSCGKEHGITEVSICRKHSQPAFVGYANVVNQVLWQLRYRLRKKRVLIYIPKKIPWYDNKKLKEALKSEAFTFTSADIDTWISLFQTKPYCTILNCWMTGELDQYKFNLDSFAHQRRILKNLPHPKPPTV